MTELAIPQAAPAVRAGGTFLHARCNPFGQETGGPKHLMGGMFGPEHEGRHKWICHNVVVVRARMICEFGHRGHPMDLCQSHAIEIQRRQSGLCPPCAWPPEARMHDEAIKSWQQELGGLAAMAQWESDRARRIRSDIESAGHRMTELFQIGVIKHTPLTLTEVS